MQKRLDSFVLYINLIATIVYIIEILSLPFLVYNHFLLFFYLHSASSIFLVAGLIIFFRCLSDSNYKFIYYILFIIINFIIGVPLRETFHHMLFESYNLSDININIYILILGILYSFATSYFYQLFKLKSYNRPLDDSLRRFLYMEKILDLFVLYINLIATILIAISLIYDNFSSYRALSFIIIIASLIIFFRWLFDSNYKFKYYLLFVLSNCFIVVLLLMNLLAIDFALSVARELFAFIYILILGILYPFAISYFYQLFKLKSYNRPLDD